LKENFIVKMEEKLIKENREAAREGRPVVVVGIIQRADAKNQNNRVYPYEILKKEVDRYVSDVVKGPAGNCSLGQLDHVDTPVIELDKVSHVLEDVWWDGPQEKEVWGKVRLLNTPKGDIAKNIVLDGIPLGISSRAVGSVESKGGCDYVKDDLNMICWDLVGTPSTNQAYLGLREAKVIHSYNPSKVYPPAYRIKQALAEILKK
jgi:hypothetical protein